MKENKYYKLNMSNNDVCFFLAVSPLKNGGMSGIIFLSEDGKTIGKAKKNRVIKIDFCKWIEIEAVEIDGKIIEKIEDKKNA